MYAKNEDSSILVLTPQQMKEDVLFFFDKVQEIHPNPHCFLNEEQYETLKRNILSEIDTPMNIYDFWMHLGRVNSAHDAHTVIHFPKNTVNYLMNENCLYFFNGMMQANDGRLFWANMAAIPDSLRGKRILTINNVPVDSIVNRLTDYASPESRIIQNEYIGGIFCIVYPLLYGKPQKLDIEYTDADRLKRITVTMHDFMRWVDETDNSEYDLSPRPPYAFIFYKEQSMALFELNSFHLGDGSAASEEIQIDVFKNALENAIDTLNLYNIQHLFIDITRNGGGTSVYADMLLDHLDIPKKTERNETTYKISDAAREIMGLNKWYKYFEIFSSKFTRKILLTPKGTTYSDKFYYTKKKTRNTYYNKVYLIQSNRTFSAAIRLSSFFKYYKPGTVIGEETKGLTATYINSYVLTLPHSGFTMTCSIQYSVEAGGKGDSRGFLPDIPYPISDDYKYQSFSVKDLQKMLSLSGDKAASCGESAKRINAITFGSGAPTP
jgi:hypothetical protein